VIRNVFVLVATLLSVTLPPTPQLTLDRQAELTAPERDGSLAAVLDVGLGEKAVDKSEGKRTPKPSARTVAIAWGVAAAMPRALSWIDETVVVQTAPHAPRPFARCDMRRDVRRARPSIQLLHCSRDDDPSAA
jgi:hypothetical protein